MILCGALRQVFVLTKRIQFNFYNDFYAINYYEFLRVNTYTSATFILQNTNLFLNLNFFLNQILPIFKFKKELLSFYFPNRLKAKLFLRKKSIFVFNKIQTLNYNLSLPNLKFLAIKLKKSFNFFFNFFYNKGISSQTPQYLPTIMAKNNLNSNQIKNLSYSKQTASILFLDEFFNRGADRSFIFNTGDVRIPRIRFRPGYQRI